ncbi:MAG: serine/threonine-protein kinase [Polyangiales bacterium]
MATAAFDREGARHRASPKRIGPGGRLDRYDIIQLIGRGGMADVWLAQQHGGHGFRKMVAIKTIRPEHAGKPSFRGRFLAEARIAASINHTNVVEILDLGEQDGVVYQVMELIEGASLAQVLETKEPLPPAIAARIAAHVARGLDAAHCARCPRGRPLRVVHRDVSPHNVLCGFDGFAKIADFGIALGLAVAEVGEGKLGYMAPEQLANAHVDARADVYGLGVVAWEALTGERFYGKKQRSSPDPRSHVREIPALLARAVERALELDPAGRFATAGEFADAIESSVELASAKELGELVRQRSAAQDSA